MNENESEYQNQYKRSRNDYHRGNYDVNNNQYGNKNRNKNKTYFIDKIIKNNLDEDSEEEKKNLKIKTVKDFY